MGVAVSAGAAVAVTGMLAIDRLFFTGDAGRVDFCSRSLTGGSSRGKVDGIEPGLLVSGLPKVGIDIVDTSVEVSSYRISGRLSGLGSSGSTGSWDNCLSVYDLFPWSMISLRCLATSHIHAVADLLIGYLY